jgi:methionyl-tRNA formyltransferase
MVESTPADKWNLQQAKKNMAGRKLKIVIWCGAAPNQRALTHKIAAVFDVAGIVIDTHSGSQKKKKRVLLPVKLWDRIRFRTIYQAWGNLMKYYDRKFPAWPELPQIKVADINSRDTEKFTREIRPDLIVVSGTALIKEPLLGIPAPIGMINLHTGLSPYVKGGPNCTNWCIANNNFQLVGNTIMWLNAGIDAGNIITTDTIDIISARDLDEAHRIVMDHAHELYLKAIGYLSQSEPPYQAVPQNSIDKGGLFLTKMWTAARKKDLLRNWKKRKFFIRREIPKTISLRESKKYEP